MIFGAKEIVGGLPAKVARDFLHNYQFSEIMGIDAVSGYCNIPLIEAEKFLAYCISKNWLAPAAVPGRYVATQLGSQAGVARIGKKITRAKAVELVSGVMQRATDWNAFPDVPLFLTDVKVFGSYLTEVPLLGDVDLSVSYRRRPGYVGMEFAETKKLVDKFARSQGWVAPTEFMSVLGFFERGLYRYLKARNPAISLVSEDQLELLNCPNQSVFYATLETPSNQAEGASSLIRARPLEA